MQVRVRLCASSKGRRLTADGDIDHVKNIGDGAVDALNLSIGRGLGEGGVQIQRGRGRARGLVRLGGAGRGEPRVATWL
jgi:hypothetical protein